MQLSIDYINAVGTTITSAIIIGLYNDASFRIGAARLTNMGLISTTSGTTAKMYFQDAICGVAGNPSVFLRRGTYYLNGRIVHNFAGPAVEMQGDVSLNTNLICQSQVIIAPVPFAAGLNCFLQNQGTICTNNVSAIPVAFGNAIVTNAGFL